MKYEFQSNCAIFLAKQEVQRRLLAVFYIICGRKSVTTVSLHSSTVSIKPLKNFYFFPGLDGLPLPPPPALGVKVLDSWEYRHSVKAT